LLLLLLLHLLLLEHLLQLQLLLPHLLQLLLQHLLLLAHAVHLPLHVLDVHALCADAPRTEVQRLNHEHHLVCTAVRHCRV